MDRMGSPTDRYSGASSGAAVIGGRRCSGWAGTPTTVVRAATSWIATAPAPITAWVPTVTLGRTVALAPTKAPMPSLAWPVMTACGESVTKSASSASWPMEQWEFTCTCAPSTAPAFTALWGQMMQPSPTLALDRTTAVGWITVAHRCRSWLARATNPSLARGSATQQTRYASGYALATSRPPSRYAIYQGTPQPIIVVQKPNQVPGRHGLVPVLHHPCHIPPEPTGANQQQLVQRPAPSWATRAGSRTI